MSKIQLTADQLDTVKRIFKKLIPDVKMLVFGSRVTDSFKPHSDLDLAICSGKKLTIAEISALKEEFADSNLPFRVDLVDWETLDDSFKQKILQNYVELNKYSP